MRIIFIDDEQRRMQPYVLELEDGEHEVVFRDDVDSALATLRNPEESFELVVLDISMPPGNEFKFEDTVGGTRTGLALYDTLRRMQPDLKIVILTNVSDPRIAEHYKGEDHRLCRFVRKPAMLPFQFAKLIEEFLNEDSEDPNDRLN